ncbi:methylenetetrahydrofolate reductase [NAD(P)H] [Campylobacter sp. LR264d]|uniref:methylenetetrahydrofolate reductase [NAD(P)H] n=1 Tax=Campylobacter sp. LR264d TaxID=2593544 RepID=UPI001238AC74|nr:methylenetetrahydrofolate reductase [NAD(P)H] [Campylobacter sp. LR264d]KAA6230125.1 methylenetetrahydrofolate reductase [NAD(P)H] [Campylobacter sp. LR264d]
MSAEFSFSYEVFPPRRGDNISNLIQIFDDLSILKPNFISVTFGAGGSINSKHTLEVANLIQNEYKISSIVHLPCIHSSKEKVSQILKECQRLGIKNILALRGDVCEGQEKSRDFSYASDLVKFIKTQGDFEIYAAAYPEKHNEAKDFVQDIHNLKIKIDAGVNKLITQMFFDNEDFYKFKEHCEIAGIKVPILTGIMPITNKRQVTKIASLCGAKIPLKFQKILDKYENNPLALEEAGIAYAIDQIVDLIASGVSGIHLYTMNKSKAAIKIYNTVKYMLDK